MFAIVPLRIDAKTKSRMSGAMTLAERQQLALAMAEDVLAALQESTSVSSILLVCPEASLPSYLPDYGVRHVAEPPLGGLDRAVHHALEVAQEQGARECIVLLGDLPVLTGKDIDRLIGDYRDRSAVLEKPGLGLVRCHHGTGTNVVLLSLPTPFHCSFGPDSFARHLSAASECDLVPLELHCANAAFDIDTKSDLNTLIDQRLSKNEPCGCHSRKWLLSHDILSLSEGVRSKNKGSLLADIKDGYSPSRDDIVELTKTAALSDLMRVAAHVRDRHHGRLITYSRKVFLPLTHLCRDVCHYCTFAVPPSRAKSPFMSIEKVLETARRAHELGCKEALFTLGEKPELRYGEARQALDKMGFATTLDYVAEAAGVVLDQTGLLPHINAGCMTEAEIEKLRKVAPSMGLMLESVSPRLSEKGGAHYGSPDKDPKIRLETMARAGAARVPFTSGILVGIGETRDEQIDSLFALRELGKEFGHLQEIIIQNFVPKPGTKMAQSAPPSLDDFVWAIAMARLIFGGKMNIQAPPNLNAGNLSALIDAGINDWGGVSPLTPDYVNPESPWPHIDALANETAESGKLLQERLTIYPEFAVKADVWTDDHVRPAVLAHMDTEGLAREDDWLTGITKELPPKIVPMVVHEPAVHEISSEIKQTLDDLDAGHVEQMTTDKIARLFTARGDDFSAVCRAADQLRETECGEDVTFVVNRNINYTNICTYRCQFCAFSKGKRTEELAGPAYLLSIEEIQQRAVEAWHRGGTELCLQGGIHPAFTGETYLGICDAIRDVLPDIHIHAFSPLEVWHGADSLGLSLETFLSRLKAAGLNSLPGTAAEILVDDVRDVICPDKINTAEWLQVMETAHGLGIPTTSTIMFGHVESYEDWVSHLLQLRNLQKRTGRFTEFVPLPFVAQEAPIYLKGQARRGPTLRESILMHAVARLVLSPYINNIQTSWVKMGGQGAALCLQAGANDIGGTLMNESITRAAGAQHGQEFTSEALESLIKSVGRIARQRTTLYGSIDSNVPRSA